jgi:hypothetical protein
VMFEAFGGGIDDHGVLLLVSGTSGSISERGAVDLEFNNTTNEGRRPGQVSCGYPQGTDDGSAEQKDHHQHDQPDGQCANEQGDYREHENYAGNLYLELEA